MDVEQANSTFEDRRRSNPKELTKPSDPQKFDEINVPLPKGITIKGLKDYEKDYQELKEKWETAAKKDQQQVKDEYDKYSQLKPKKMQQHAYVVMDTDLYKLHKFKEAVQDDHDAITSNQ